MLTVITLKWGTKYTSAHVNILYRSLLRHLNAPFKMVCFTDDEHGLDDNIIKRPLWDNPLNLEMNYRKLKVFDPSIAGEFNHNFLLMDIDAVITGDLSILSDATSNMIWKSKSQGKKNMVYNTSIVRIVDDSYSHMWKLFIENPSYYIREAKTVDGWVGSDQAIVSYFVKGNIDTVTEDDGFVSIRDHKALIKNSIPRNVRYVSFYGGVYGDPHDPNLRKTYHWIDTHWTSLATEDDLRMLSIYTPFSQPVIQKPVTSLQHPKIIKPVNTTKKVLREPAFDSDPLTELDEVIRNHNVKKLRMKHVVNTRHPDEVYNEIMIMLRES